MLDLLICVGVPTVMCAVFYGLHRLVEFHYSKTAICTLPGFELPLWSDTIKRLWSILRGKGDPNDH
jgi:hypothetical protein